MHCIHAIPNKLKLIYIKSGFLHFSINLTFIFSSIYLAFYIYFLVVQILVSISLSLLIKIKKLWRDFGKRIELKITKTEFLNSATLLCYHEDNI